MDAEVVLPRGDDGGEPRPLGPVLADGVVEHGLVLVLVHAGLAGLHHGGDARAGDFLGLAHGFQLAGLLDGAHPPDEGVGVLHPQEGVVAGHPAQQQVGGLVPVGGGDPEQIQVQVLVVAAGGQLVQVAFKVRHIANLLDAGEVCGLVGLNAGAGPALGHPVRGQNVHLLRHLALAVLAGNQGQLFLVQAGQVQKVPVGVKGVEFVVGLADLHTGEQHQQGVLLQLGVQPFPVALVKIFVHKSLSSLLRRGREITNAGENAGFPPRLQLLIVFHPWGKCNWFFWKNKPPGMGKAGPRQRPGTGFSLSR